MISVRTRIWSIALISGITFALATVATGAGVDNFNLDDATVALALFVILVVIERADVKLPVGAGSYAFTVSGPIMIAGVMRHGVLIGTTIVFLALLVDSLLARRDVIKSVTNISSYVLAVSIAGLIYVKFAESGVSPVSSFHNFLVAIPAGLAYTMISSWSLALIVGPVFGMTPLAFWQSNFFPNTTEFVTLPTLGGMIVVLAEENAIAVLLLLLPLLAPQLAYRTLQRAQRNIRDTLESLADAIERRDRYTANHSARVAGYAKAMLAQIPEIPDQLSATILAAARVHDVGKVGIKDSTLLKPGPLTTAERQDLQMHTVVGADIVSRIAEYRLCAATIRHHHERWDGAGYPDGLAGEDIPIGSRIICVADAFDAMTSDRPYRRAMSAEAAIEEVRRNAGSQFDPRVVAAFERVMAGSPRPQPDVVPVLAATEPTFVS